MKDSNYDFFDIITGSLLVAAFILVICFALSSCKTVRSLKKSTSDSTSVSKVNEQTAKKDSSGNKTESTKETVYYPQPIYIPGKDGETKVVFVPQVTKETGKTEQAQVIVDNSWRSSFDSLSKMVLALSDNRQTKVGFSTFEIIMMIAGGIIVLKMFGPTIIKLITKV